MRKKFDERIPRYTDLIVPTFQVLKELGGSGKNDEILAYIIEKLELPDEVVDFPHKGRPSLSELSYQLMWARTYLKKYGVIENSARSVWSILPEYMQQETLDGKLIVQTVVQKGAEQRKGSKEHERPNDDEPADEEIDLPDEVKPWRQRLQEILQTMDPYGFERLTQRILRECGFTQVEVTKKSGDGGIDGTGKLRINGLFSFHVAFQCKRYSGVVGSGEVRDFRGSLNNNIEKGLLITTGTFSKAARVEAADPGKRLIDLMDGEELIDKIVEYSIGVHEVTDYGIDEEFFEKILSI